MCFIDSQKERAILRILYLMLSFEWEEITHKGNSHRNEFCSCFWKKKIRNPQSTIRIHIISISSLFKVLSRYVNELWKQSWQKILVKLRCIKLVIKRIKWKIMADSSESFTSRTLTFSLFGIVDWNKSETFNASI